MTSLWMMETVWVCFVIHTKIGWAEVVAQLIELFLIQLLANLYLTFVYCQLFWKDENKEKRPGMTHLKKTKICHFEA